MQIGQHRLLPTRQEQPPIHWQTESTSPRSTTMSNRVYQPLTFSIDDRLSEQHLTKLDLCSKNLKKIEQLPNNIHFNVVLLDYNDITKVEHLDILTHLIQLSISHNRLIDIRLLSRLRTLQKLNLSNNSLDSIDCLKTLQNLIMLNISNNNIQNLGALNTCHSLQSLDASDNSIRQIEDFTHLTSLKYLNLHKNLIDTLISAPKYWPKSIHTLVISDNEIKDLTEVSYLSSLIDLNTLYIYDNPCLFIINDRHGCHQPFDYRPYVLNWSLAIQNLDGISITRKESLKAEWLLSQGKGRSFRPGEHQELVQYLIKVCGTDADERDDLHLSRIMFQQDLYRHHDDEEVSLKTSDTLTKDSHSKFQQSLLLSESEFVQISPTSPIHESLQIQTSINDDQNSTNRYSDYDNRPIKPLDQCMFQSKLNQYPVDHIDTNISRPRVSTNPQQSKRTPREPTTSAVIRPKSTKNPTKRHTIAADNSHTFDLLNRITSAPKIKQKQPTDDEEELQLKSAPVNGMLSSQSARKGVGVKKLPTSMETMRTSILQAYLDLHERFTKTTELQTSALAALWKMFETENLTHQRQTEQILEENRLLTQRLHDLESRLNRQSCTLHPPLRVHISKRDTKSFFLHWIPNPLNEQRTILGYRIYIDNILKYSIDSGKFEAIIDCIQNEGEYKIKLRTYDENGESDDSNIVVAKFRRQYSNPSEIQTIHRTQSDQMVDNINNQIELRETQSQENLINSPKSKDIEGNQPMSSSPSQSNHTDSSNRSPIRTGVMSRFAKSPHRIKRNNVLLNALPINLTPSSTETGDTTEPEIDQSITFPPELTSSSNHILFQQLPITSIETLNSSPPQNKISF